DILGVVENDGTVATGVVLESIAATPAAVTVSIAGTQQLTVTAPYDDASTVDVTATSTYVSDNEAVATVTSPGGGLITGVAQGTATVTVSYTEGAVTVTTDVPVRVMPDLHSISVTPAWVNVAVGHTQQLGVTAYYWDMSTVDVTDECHYVSDNEAVATVISPGGGLITGVAQGTATVTVCYIEGAVT
ncbi:unnamed protein product, partial [marine sediment metagenome]